jgi:hypothetical protein
MRSGPLHVLKAAFALSAAAVSLAGCGEAAIPSKDARPESALLVRCEPRSTQAPATVDAQEDGVTFRVENSVPPLEEGSAVIFLVFYTDDAGRSRTIQIPLAEPSEELTLSLPPGSIQVGCVSTPLHIDEVDGEILASLEVRDPDDFWRPTEPDCALHTEPLVVLIADGQSPIQAVHSMLEGLRPSDSLAHAGYPEDRRSRMFTVTRDRSVVFSVRVQPVDSGLITGSAQICDGSGISVREWEGRTSG